MLSICYYLSFGWILIGLNDLIFGLLGMELNYKKELIMIFTSFDYGFGLHEME